MPSEREKLQRLKETLESMGKMAVAYSGGTDSTFLLKVARDELGEGAIAIFNASRVISPFDAEEAARGARELGAELVVTHADVMADETFRMNEPDRCYRCKKIIFQTVIEAAAARGIEIVADGSHVDDLKEDRPGRRALQELGVRSPLADVGLGKDEIRRLSREMGIRTADRPANPCLATRIAFFEPITPEKLEQVDRAERFIRGLGVRVVRVRHHGNLARIEVLPEEFTAILRNREKIASELRSLGFTYTDLDLFGYRPGSFTEALQGH